MEKVILLNCKQYSIESVCNKEPMETEALLFFYSCLLFFVLIAFSN